MKPIIAILINTRGLVFTRTIQKIIFEANKYPHGFFFTEDIKLPDARNIIVKEAIQIKDFTHFLFIDEDIDIPVHGIAEMLKLDTDIAMIDYPMHWTGKRGGESGTIAYNFWLPECKGKCKHKPEVHDIKGKPIAWGGLGCTLIKRQVFEKIKYPWFKSSAKMFLRKQHTGEIYYTGINEAQGGGEDYYFYTQAKKEGFNMKVVENMVAGHGKIMKHIGVLSEGKYINCHDIMWNFKITHPVK